MTYTQKHKIGVPKITGVPDWAISYSVLDDKWIDLKIKENITELEKLINLKFKS